MLCSLEYCVEKNVHHETDDGFIEHVSSCHRLVIKAANMTEALNKAQKIILSTTGVLIQLTDLSICYITDYDAYLTVTKGIMMDEVERVCE